MLFRVIFFLIRNPGSFRLFCHLHIPDRDFLIRKFLCFYRSCIIFTLYIWIILNYNYVYSLTMTVNLKKI